MNAIELEIILEAQLESSKNEQTILRTLSQLLDDMAEIKESIKYLSGKQQ
jgi:hypothetical protein